MNGQQKILSVWAFTQMDTDDTEGIVAVLIHDKWTPLVGADLARVRQMLPLAQTVADTTQRPVTLAHFSLRTDEITLPPR